MKKLVSAFSLLAMISMAAPAFADTTSTISQIQALLGQLQALQAQMQALKAQQQQITANLISTLSQGSSGDQVKILQAILAADPSIYPEGLITGTFGRLTAKAVRKFQERNGLEGVGNVGPRTLKMLNEFLKEHPIALEFSSASSTNSTSTGNLFWTGRDRDRDRDEEHHPCAIVPPGHLIAPGWLKKHHEDDERSIVPPCQTIPPGIWNKLEDEDEDENEDENDRHSTSTDVTAPVIFNVGNSAATSTAAVSWGTNELATSQVFYGTSTALGLNTAIDAALVTSHAQTLIGLAPSTTYYYMVRSADASGNAATSSQGSFTTSAVDTTPPVISAVTSTVTTSTATIGWGTNEPATSQVFYGTSTAMGSNTAFDANLVTTHSATITGLAATTTYYYQVQSKDASGNVASSSQGSFITQG